MSVTCSSLKIKKKLGLLFLLIGCITLLSVSSCHYETQTDEEAETSESIDDNTDSEEWSNADYDEYNDEYNTDSIDEESDISDDIEDIIDEDSWCKKNLKLFIQEPNLPRKGNE